MNQATWWYTVRASGIVAWAVLTASVVWGLVLSIRPIRRPRPAWVLDLHRFLGALGLAFVGVHLLALGFDSFIGFGLVDLFVPFASHWQPTATAWGVLALYVLLAVELTSLVRRHLPRRVWHGIHLLSLVAFGLVIAHGLSAGTDADGLWALVGAIGSSALVLLLVVIRVIAGVRAGSREAVPARPAPVPALTWTAPALEQPVSSLASRRP
jgi:predicted ferric reductase